MQIYLFFSKFLVFGSIEFPEQLELFNELNWTVQQATSTRKGFNVNKTKEMGKSSFLLGKKQVNRKRCLHWIDDDHVKSALIMIMPMQGIFCPNFWSNKSKV